MLGLCAFNSFVFQLSEYIDCSCSLEHVMRVLLTGTVFRVPAFSRALAAPARQQAHVFRLRSAQASRPARQTMGAAFSASSQSNLAAMIKEKNEANPIMVYSKTYCPYCSEVKGLFSGMGVPFKVVELDELADGAEVQAALQRVTGRSTVPQVFIGTVHVGGCDDTLAANSSGKLKELMLAAGVSV